MIGPGRADLLELIRETGSTAAAGRRLGMSYERAWSLVETTGAIFDAPLVQSARGGALFGGARLTGGEAVPTNHHCLQARAARSAAAEVAALRRLRADRCDGT